MSEREAIARLAAALTNVLTFARDEAVARQDFQQGVKFRGHRDEVRAIAREFKQPEESTERPTP